MINKKILTFLDNSRIEKLAKEVRVVIRKSKITGFSLLLTFTMGLLNTPESSLNKLSMFLNLLLKVHVTPQGLDNRITQKLVKFLKHILEEILNKLPSIKESKNILKRFDRVYLIDSTSFDLHADQEKKYKGFGGSASVSAMRIQLLYEYLSGKLGVKIGDRRLSDAPTLKELIYKKIKKEEKNSLFIEDLGYYDIETFKLIDKNDMYFLSKIKRTTNLIKENGVSINFEELNKKSIRSIDTKVVMQGKVFRLVGHILPKEEWEKRIRKINLVNKKKKRKSVSKEEKNIIKWNLFLTNIEGYKYEQLYSIYRIRWQIELIFKSWKSILKINKVRSFKKEERLLSEIYGKLIVAALSCDIKSNFKTEKQKIVSYYKLLTILESIAVYWAIEIFNGIEAHRRFLQFIKDDMMKMIRKCESRSKPSIETILSKWNKAA